MNWIKYSTRNLGFFFNEMIRLYQVIIVSYVCLVLIVTVHTVQGNEPRVHRERRYLAFENISHFFMRINYKANMVPWNQIFAQALGFRLNYDEPPDSFHPYHHLNRRTVYTHLETILDRSGVNGYHCIRRAICEMAMMTEPQSLYYKILSMVFRAGIPFIRLVLSMSIHDGDLLLRQLLKNSKILQEHYVHFSIVTLVRTSLCYYLA